MACRRTRTSPGRSAAGSTSTYRSASMGPGAETRIACITYSPPCNLVALLPGRIELALDLRDPLLVAPVEGPLLDPFRTQQPGVHEDAQVLTGRWLTHAELVRDEHTAYAVTHEVAVGLRREVLARPIQPTENLQPPLAGECLDHRNR